MLSTNAPKARKPVFMKRKIGIRISDTKKENENFDIVMTLAMEAVKPNGSATVVQPSPEGSMEVVTDVNTLVLATENLEHVIVEDGSDSDTAANVETNVQGGFPEKLTVKRALPAPSERSPSKVQHPLPELLQRKEDSVNGKKQKRPEFPGKLTARSLNLSEASGDILVTKDKMQTKTEPKKEKKKRGRPIGSQNRNPPRS